MNLSTFTKSIQDIMRADAGINGDAQRIEQLTWLLFLKIYGSKEENWAIVDADYQSIIEPRFQWQNWATDNKDGNALTGEALLGFIDRELFPALKNLRVNEHTPLKQRIVRDIFQDAKNFMKTAPSCASSSTPSTKSILTTPKNATPSARFTKPS